MFEILNSLASLLLVCLLFPVANAMHPRGFWTQRIGLWIIVLSLGLQACGPLFDWLPPANPAQAIFMVMLAGVVVRQRHQIMAGVRLAVGDVAANSDHEWRRVEDLELVQTMAVRGRGVD